MLLNTGGSTFSRYLIGSPSLWWDDGFILKAEAARAESGKPISGRVFLSVGSAEGNKAMVDPLKALTTALASHAYPDLRLETHIFDGADHLSGLQGAFARGIRFLYARPRTR